MSDNGCPDCGGLWVGAFYTMRHAPTCPRAMPRDEPPPYTGNFPDWGPEPYAVISGVRPEEPKPRP